MLHYFSALDKRKNQSENRPSYANPESALKIHFLPSSFSKLILYPLFFNAKYFNIMMPFCQTILKQFFCSSKPSHAVCQPKAAHSQRAALNS